MAASLISLAGCSSIAERHKEEPVDAAAAAAPAPKEDLVAENGRLQKRVESLEEKVALLTDRLSAAQTTMDAIKPKPVIAKASAVHVNPVDAAGSPPDTVDAQDEEKSSDFTSDGAIEKYRSALILFRAEKYSEATLEFTTFIRTYPDHPFAGAAQYYIGESYFKQGEYKLAADEFNRVLVSYDQVSFVPDALKRLTQCQEQMKMPKQAAHHRQLLLSLFPQSPSAKEILEAKMAPAVFKKPVSDSRPAEASATATQNTGTVPTAPVNAIEPRDDSSAHSNHP
jgi:tol-pal system protein YbgF